MLLGFSTPRLLSSSAGALKKRRCLRRILRGRLGRDMVKIIAYFHITFPFFPGQPAPPPCVRLPTNCLLVLFLDSSTSNSKEDEQQLLDGDELLAGSTGTIIIRTSRQTMARVIMGMNGGASNQISRVIISSTVFNESVRANQFQHGTDDQSIRSRNGLLNVIKWRKRRGRGRSTSLLIFSSSC